MRRSSPGYYSGMIEEIRREIVGLLTGDEIEYTREIFVKEGPTKFFEWHLSSYKQVSDFVGLPQSKRELVRSDLLKFVYLVLGAHNQLLQTIWLLGVPDRLEFLATGSAREVAKSVILECEEFPYFPRWPFGGKNPFAST